MKKTGLIIIIGIFMLALPLQADEGMWTFNNPPRAQLKNRYKFDATDAWLEHVRLASVRFNNGGSGSFVSAQGLIMTNHHVGADCLQKVSTAGKDYYREGFYAQSLSDEIKCPDLELNVLTSIEDVTAPVNAAVKPDMDDAARHTAQRGAMATIEKECATGAGRRCDVVTLYQGGQFHLYQYKKYTDVRIAFSPEFDIAFFGGDPDNFMFPRYDLDICFARAYENDQPARIAHYLKWSPQGARHGDLVFVSGHPGSTARLHTLSRLEYSREVGYPLSLRLLEHEYKVLKAYSGRGAEQARQVKESLFSVENSLKASKGEWDGLKSRALMDKKRAAEKALRQEIAANPKRQAEYGGAWEAMAEARKKFAAFVRPYMVLEGGAGFDSELFRLARMLVRLAAEKQASNETRLREYRESNLPSLEQQLYSPAPLYDEFETAKLAGSLAFLREELGSIEVPLVNQILSGRQPDEVARELVSGTRLKAVEVRKELAQGGTKAIEGSQDPMIKLARLVDAPARALRKRYEDEIQSVERKNYALIARALFDLKGTRLYPDATFTLRLSYGTVKGYTENGKKISYFTTLGGTYDRAQAKGHQPPYQLPKSWTEKKSALNLKTPFNFVSTADIIGGNSGSPVINRQAEVVGLIFDGNIQSLILNFIYDDQQARAIAVHSEGILVALTKIYNALRVVDELRPAAGK